MIPHSMTEHSMKLFELWFRIDVLKPKQDENKFCLFVTEVASQKCCQAPNDGFMAFPYSISVTRLVGLPGIQ